MSGFVIANSANLVAFSKQSKTLFLSFNKTININD